MTTLQLRAKHGQLRFIYWIIQFEWGCEVAKIMNRLSLFKTMASRPKLRTSEILATSEKLSRTMFTSKPIITSFYLGMTSVRNVKVVCVFTEKWIELEYINSPLLKTEKPIHPVWKHLFSTFSSYVQLQGETRARLFIIRPIPSPIPKEISFSRDFPATKSLNKVSPEVWDWQVGNVQLHY